MSNSAAPWAATSPAPLSFTLSQSLLKFMSIESVMLSNHLILCCTFLLLPSIIPSIRVFSSESASCIREPKNWSFSFSISPSIEYSGLISFRMDWLDLLAVQGTPKSLLQHHSSKASILQRHGEWVIRMGKQEIIANNSALAATWNANSLMNLRRHNILEPCNYYVHVSGLTQFRNNWHRWFQDRTLRTTDQSTSHTLNTGVPFPTTREAPAASVGRAASRRWNMVALAHCSWPSLWACFLNTWTSDFISLSKFTHLKTGSSNASLKAIIFSYIYKLFAPSLIT